MPNPNCNKCHGSGEYYDDFIIFAGGSMGMGLSAGVALAWSKKQRKQEGKVFVFESDGGMQVGINWEAAWFAAQHKLDNLVLIIDRNGFQAMKKTKDILDCSKMQSKMESFGWLSLEIDGHDFGQIERVLDVESYEEPICIIANTIKGKGWTKAENNNLYHYKQLSEEEYNEALIELNG